MRWKIQPMTLADFEAVFRLWQNTEGIGLGESDTRPGIAGYLKRNPGMSFVARCGTEVIGAVLCGHDGRRGYLHHLAVARAFRKQGLGSALVQACLERLAALGIPKCNLFLFADNADGEAFWRHTGWATRADLAVMQRALPPERGAGSVRRET